MITGIEIILLCVVVLEAIAIGIVSKQSRDMDIDRDIENKTELTRMCDNIYNVKKEMYDLYDELEEKIKKEM